MCVCVCVCVCVYTGVYLFLTVIKTQKTASHIDL